MCFSCITFLFIFSSLYESVSLSVSVLWVCSLVDWLILPYFTTSYVARQRRELYTKSVYLYTSRLCLATHLRTSPTTYIWSPNSPKVIDGGYASTDRSCVVSRTHNTFGDRSFAVAGPRVWNSLPAHLRDEDINTTVSGVNSKLFCFNVAFGAQWVLLIALYKYPCLLTYLLNPKIDCIRRRTIHLQ